MSDSEHDFNQLQKLLECKRYEQPPPGYFISFSDRVIARIEAEHSTEEDSWWGWLINRFDAKPVLVCAYGLAVSSLLLMGFRLSEVFDAELAASPAVGGPWLAATPVSPILLSQDLPRASFAGWEQASFPRPGWLVREESSHLLLPQGSLRPRAVAFTGEH